MNREILINKIIPSIIGLVIGIILAFIIVYTSNIFSEIHTMHALLSKADLCQKD